jgi:pimeloyl-ACP methyl ester carboxylesterase
VNGLGSQCTGYAEAWCQRFVDEGYQVIRFDNRDVGLSSKLEGIEYALSDMARDAVAVLDAVGVERAHVMGLSMGGMIVQRLAIDHPDRLLTMTSVMSRTGEPGFGESSPEALAILMGKPATSREEHIESHVKGIATYGSEPAWIEESDTRARAAAAYDRCFCPEGVARQWRAVAADGSRTEALREVSVPTLVLHGSRDTLIDPSGGRRTAEVVPGARYIEIEGMGHDYPPAVWDQWVSTWADFARSAHTGVRRS